MARPSHREKILTEGLRVVHERGFGAASVRDIVRAAGVPQGSFTNHFASKEAFALEVLERYYAETQAMFDETLRNATLTPLARIRAYLDGATTRQCADGVRNGCMIGNFSAEIGEQSEPIRARVAEMLRETQALLMACLANAVAAGELAPDTDVEATAVLIQASQQGATLLAKTLRDPAPLEQLNRVLCATVLGRAERNSLDR